MRSQTAPTVIQERTKTRIIILSIIVEHVVEPERIGKSRIVFGLLPLLPVKPPEVIALIFNRLENRLIICICPFLLIDMERNRLARLVPSLFLAETVIALFIRLDT